MLRHLVSAALVAAVSGSAFAQSLPYNRAVSPDITCGPSSSGAGYQISGEIRLESDGIEEREMGYVLRVMVNGALAHEPIVCSARVVGWPGCDAFCSTCHGTCLTFGGWLCICFESSHRAASPTPSFSINVPELHAGDRVTVMVDALPASVTEIETSDDQVSMVVGVPSCPADFNNDGAVNSADFFAFLQSFFVFDPSADFNADGSVNSQDFFDFLGAFFDGC